MSANEKAAPEIDRIDGVKQQNLFDFSPEAAKSNKRKIIIEGRKYDSVQSAARAFGLSRNTVDYRLSKGWTPEEAVGLEPRPDHAGRTAGVPVEVQGLNFPNIKQAAKHFGRAYTHVIERLKQGCTIEQALGLVKRTDSLQTEYPELAKQWHPTKNASLTVDTLAPHSGQKVWWLCSHGHEWKAVINSRTKGHGCPFCAGQKPTANRNFSTEYPELVKEWDIELNDHARPEDFTPRSKSKVWWQCKKGHSWQETIQNRTRQYDSKCPYCSNRRLCVDNSLARVRPDIAEDWHPYKNVPLTPNGVIAGGYKKVWWICKHGHEWKTAVGLRVNAGTGCPKCSLQTSRIEIAVYSELDALFNDVAWREKISGYECDIYLRDKSIGVEIDGVYWHSRRPEQELAKSAAFEAEGIQLFRLREDGLSLLSERDISFKISEDEFLVISKLASSLLKYAKLSKQQCEKLHRYINGPGLVNEKFYRELVASLPAPPPGQSLADKKPKLAAQWAYDLNTPLSPEHFWPAANKYVWWRCNKDHTWKASINNRSTQNIGCPGCAGQVATETWNLATVNPELASEWHPDKNGNLSPQDVTPKSNKKTWWQCANGHAWKATPSNRAGKGSGCPYCYGRDATKENNLAIKFPKLVEEWDSDKNIGLHPSEFLPFSAKKVWWRCKEGHSWQAVISNRTNMKSGCPACARNARRKYSIEDFQSIAKQRGGECLSEVYTSCRSKLKFRCKEGHLWETRADSVLYTNKWCPVCGRRR